MVIHSAPVCEPPSHALGKSHERVCVCVFLILAMAPLATSATAAMPTDSILQAAPLNLDASPAPPLLRIDVKLPLLDSGIRFRSLSGGIRCQSGRRHHRRREMDSLSAKAKSAFLNREKGFVQERRGVVDEEKVVVTLDLEDIKNRAADVVEQTRHTMQATAQRVAGLGKAVAADSTEFWRDLRSSIRFQNDTRIVISLSRSSIEFVGNALFWSVLVVAACKIFMRAAKRYRWGWEQAGGSKGLLRRDRSLGGKEVLVSRKGADPQGNASTLRAAREGAKIVSPLDGVDVTRSEKTLLMQRRAQKERVAGSAGRLPGWWQDCERPSTVLALDGDHRKAEASAVVQAMMEKRLNGKDFEEEDILQLRRICKYSGVNVRFDTLTVRDSFYRAAIDFVLSSCGRLGTGSTHTDYAGEKATHFIAGLADNIGMEENRAANMVNAAVAAQTRSTFLQAWALHMQGRDPEAEEELFKLGCIHLVFPPEKNSPEMEMVGLGLGKYLVLEERKCLLQMYSKTVGSSGHMVACEALGLVSMGERT